MFSSFRQHKAICLVVHTACNILNNGLISGAALGKPMVNRCDMGPLTRLADVGGWRFVMLSNNDALDKSVTVLRLGFVTNGPCNHHHDFLVAILSIRRCCQTDDVSSADLIKQHLVTWR